MLRLTPILRKLHLMDKIDFRSDTVSWPTPEMREVMATAAVGDDVFGDDPTVNELEALAAEMTGKEAALYVSSGTQGNLISMMVHAGRGDEAVIGDDSHVFNYEAGGMAVLGGIVPRPLPTDEIGRMNVDQVRAAFRPDDSHRPVSRLICTENSSGGNYGAAIPADYFAQLREIADEQGLGLHLDGARLFNATTALGIDVKEIMQYVDSASICLSKGLCAPVGSVIVGDKRFIHQAHRLRKMLGSGMRQAGIIAAAGIIALRDMTQRLDIDHANAQRLAQGLAQIPHIDIDPTRFQTNMVFFNVMDSSPLSVAQIEEKLRDDYGILTGAYRSQGFRVVIHYWTTEKEVDKLLNALRELLA